MEFVFCISFVDGIVEFECGALVLWGHQDASSHGDDYFKIASVEMERVVAPHEVMDDIWPRKGAIQKFR